MDACEVAEIQGGIFERVDKKMLRGIYLYLAVTVHEAWCCVASVLISQL